jgi:hypothetical protein
MKFLKHTLGLAAAAGLLLASAPAAAAEILKTLPAKLDSKKAYALVELRNVDDKKMKGSLVLARYDAEGGDVRGGARAPATALPKGVPVRVAIAGKALVKAPKSRLYLVALEPDTWVIEGSGGTAFSLGSNRFTVAAGDVLDLGVVTPRTDYREGEGPPKLTVGKLAAMSLLGGFAAKRKAPNPMMVEVRARSATDIALPALVKARAASPAYVEGAKFGNYLGGLVNRIEGRKGRPGAEPAATGIVPAAATTSETPPSN